MSTTLGEATVTLVAAVLATLALDDPAEVAVWAVGDGWTTDALTVLSALVPP